MHSMINNTDITNRMFNLFNKNSILKCNLVVRNDGKVVENLSICSRSKYRILERINGTLIDCLTDHFERKRSLQMSVFYS